MIAVKDALDLYREYVAKHAEVDADAGEGRMRLWREVAAHADARRVLYPGSYVEATPALVWPEVVFNDQDARARRFFASPDVRAWLEQEAPGHVVRYHHGDYATAIDEPEGSFDLLLSQYAGPVGQACKRYLRRGGLLLANNSHGDAGLAHVDPDYELVAVVRRRWSDDVEGFFEPKRPPHPDREELLRLGRGVGYTKTAPQYVFRRR